MIINGKEWPITIIIICSLLGSLLLFIAWGTLFGVFDPESPTSENIKGGALLIFLATIFLFPIYEVIRKNIFGKNTLSDNAVAAYSKALAELPTDPLELRKKRILATIKILIFIVFIITPIIWPKRPTYEYSTNSLTLMWLVIFPLFSIRWKSIISFDFKKILGIGRTFLSACLVVYLFFYIEIAQSYLNTETKKLNVSIESVTRDARGGGKGSFSSCSQRVSVKNSEKIRKDFCAGALRKHNLVDGDVAYIDNGNATMYISEGWLGSVVDSITWVPTYTQADREWSVKEQKFIYYDDK